VESGFGKRGKLASFPSVAQACVGGRERGEGGIRTLGYTVIQRGRFIPRVNVNSDIKKLARGSYSRSYYFVASVWKHPNSPYWAACFSVHTPGAEFRWKRSIKTRDVKAARRIAEGFEEAGRGVLTERDTQQFCEKIRDTKARRAALQIFNDIFRAVYGRDMGGASLQAFAVAWLQRLQPELAPQSYDKYKQIIEAFIRSIGSDGQRDVTSFGAHDDRLVLQFRDKLAERVAPGTVNTALKIVRQMFKGAAQRFKIDSPAHHVGGLRKKEGSDGPGRRRFNLPEIGRLLRAAKGSEWEGIILAGFYTAGQRLSDIATWRFENIDLVDRELRFTSRKTGRRMLIPLAEPLATYLESLPSSDDPTAFVFPIAAGHVLRAKSQQTATLSNQFHELLAQAGLVRRRSHRAAKDGKGRSARRAVSELSFHSFRHTATSLLKSAGVAHSVVMDIVGHESKAVSDVYTHVGDEEKRAAVSAFPPINKLV
jgi:integrase